MHRGYIKIWRKIEDSGLIQLPNTLAVFMHILLNASHKDMKVGTPNGIISIQRGQYISGRIQLASKLKQSQQQIRTSLDRLVNLEILTIKSTNKYSIYTIENYDNYQDVNQQTTNKSTNKQPTDNQQITTKQELKNLNTKDNAKALLAHIDPQIANDWLAIRKAKKLPLTKTALDKIESEAKKVGLTLEQALKICCEKSWAGFSSTWDEVKAIGKPAEEDWYAKAKREGKVL
jgi:hypothetical protein